MSYEVLSVNEIRKHYNRFKCASKKKALIQSKPCFVRIVDVLKDSVQKNEAFIELIENDVLCLLSGDDKKYVIDRLNELEGLTDHCVYGKKVNF